MVLMSKRLRWGYKVKPQPGQGASVSNPLVGCHRTLNWCRLTHHQPCTHKIILRILTKWKVLGKYPPRSERMTLPKARSTVTKLRRHATQTTRLGELYHIEVILKPDHGSCLVPTLRVVSYPALAYNLWDQPNCGGSILRPD